MASIIFINRFFYPDHSATSQLLSDVAFHLTEKGMDVKIVTSRQLYDDPDVVLASNENINLVSVNRVWTTTFGRNNLLGRALDYISFYISAFFVLMKLVKENDYVVAKTDPPMISIVAKTVCSLRSAKLINWNQDLFPEVGTELGIKILKYTKPVLVYLRDKALKGARMNVVLGETMKTKLVSLGVDQNKISIIPNWSDGREIYPVEKDNNPLRKKWGLKNKFVVGYSGNMGRAHEFETMLSIAEKLRFDESIIFVFIGGGAKKPWLEQEVKKRQLNNILFKPYQTREHLALSLSVPDMHLISLFPNLEGLVVPSKYYGVAAVGRPCLFIGDCDGEISKIIRDNNCGKPVEIGDVHNGVNYIVKMKSSEEKYAVQCKNARELFNKSYDSLIAFQKWEEMLALS